MNPTQEQFSLNRLAAHTELLSIAAYQTLLKELANQAFLSVRLSASRLVIALTMVASLASFGFAQEKLPSHLKEPLEITATFSIVAVGPETGTAGAAVASKYPAAGMETRQLDEKFTQTELKHLEGGSGKVEQATKIKDDRIRQLEESMRILKKNFDAVSKVLNLNPTDT